MGRKRKTEDRNSVPVTVFTLEKKKQLARLVHSFPCLWDLGNAEHQNSAAQTSAWDTVANGMAETGADCRRIWKSMRQSLRYRKNKKQKGKSGDSQEDASQDQDQDEDRSGDDESNTDWTLWNDMKFLVDTKETRSTMSSMGLEETPPPTPNPPVLNEDEGNAEGAVNVTEELFGPVTTGEVNKSAGKVVNSSKGTPTNTNNHSSVYSFASRFRKPDATDKLAESVSEFVKMRKENLALTKPEEGSRELKFYTMFANLDRMWKKLPESTVEDLNMQITSATHQALSELELTTVYTINPLDD